MAFSTSDEDEDAKKPAAAILPPFQRSPSRSSRRLQSPQIEVSAVARKPTNQDQPERDITTTTTTTTSTLAMASVPQALAQQEALLEHCHTLRNAPAPLAFGIPKKILIPSNPRNNIRRKKKRMVRMSPTTFLHIHGTKLAWDAISNGTAVICSCSTCRHRFQIQRQATLLYCTNCNTVTSLEVAKNDDHQLAQELQQVEFQRSLETLDHEQPTF